MSIAEAKMLLKHEHLAHADDWRMAQSLAYITAQVNSTKRLKPNDILPLYWEQERIKENTSISNEDIERLKEQAKKWQKDLPHT